jgi:hypothetical protein
MTERIPQGSWVEIGSVVLAAGQRAPQVPDDTRAVDLELRVKGFLLAEAQPGEAVAIRTVAGRELHGTLLRLNPSYDHSFGAPLAELSVIGGEARALLQRGSNR